MAAHAGALAPPLLPLPPRPPLRSRLLTPSTTLSSLRSRGPRLAVARAASGGGDGGGGPPAEGDEKEQKGLPSFPSLSGIRWRDILSPEPANATAVVLTGAIAWAGASLLLQLVLIFFSIFTAAVKYSFIAAVLLFILIALL
ncbi:hypothetical protein PR202_gb00269 [Eleusine coracana subsp. coracana]|uniref:Uncharacterized protein n=1 Tax=Eleusine coracana subsp. coracana TaxID=191504 RepID=A0AAV5DTA8_ELECO|nr:hypothetical protein QOZ80_5BG0432020 [Eleusine coracana subsp. coracana]GJN13553.1 hypothetical protein PR202_gb00269 [Eleusine coracana subsp. coracana]